jgi:dihydropteroate synthase
MLLNYLKKINDKMQIQLEGTLYTLDTPQVWGILNVTPDSFFDGGHYKAETAYLKRTEQILQEGAMIIDVGGYSSRPQATDISIEEELKRVLPAITNIKKHFPEALISIDTFRAEVAKQAIEAGACLVNDISGGTLDANLWETVAKARVPYTLMHMRGTPQTMTKLTDYEDVVKEVYFYFSEKIAQLRTLKQHDIIIDLGFGFAKTVAQNFTLLQNLEYFHNLNLPILVGVSRKSMIYKTLQTSAENALNGTTVLHTIAILKKAHFLRVHDVKEAVEAIKLVGLLDN